MKKNILIFSLIFLLILILIGCFCYNAFVNFSFIDFNEGIYISINFKDFPPKKDYNYQIPNGTTVVDRDKIPKKIRKYVTSITVPDSVIDIKGMGSGLWECKYLKSINIPKNVKKIDDSTFSLFRYLTNVEISDGVTQIGENAFYTCESLTEIKIPDSVTKIKCRAFKKCKNLKKVTLPNNIIKIKEATFCDCNSLTEIIIPDTVREIEEEAFKNCRSLDVKIPNSVTEIEENAFQDVKHIEYHGNAEGAPWGAKSMN